MARTKTAAPMQMQTGKQLVYPVSSQFQSIQTNMTESEFNLLADAVLERIDAGLEASGADLDWELKDGGVLEIECADGSKIIVNRHGIAREIWVAARSGGFHFRHDPASGTHAWVNTRDGDELFVALSRVLSEQSGETVTLR